MPAKKKLPCPKNAKRKRPYGSHGLAKGGALRTFISVGGVTKPDRGLPAARAVQGLAVPTSWAARPTKTA